MPYTAEARRSWRERRIAADPEYRKVEYERSRASFLKRAYGITVEEYERLHGEQGGLCAICQRPEEGQRLAVDHCHETGKVRGLLCRKCNTAMGSLGDTAEKIRRVIDYLE